MALIEVPIHNLVVGGNYTIIKTFPGRNNPADSERFYGTFVRRDEQRRVDNRVAIFTNVIYITDPLKLSVTIPASVFYDAIYDRNLCNLDTDIQGKPTVPPENLIVGESYIIYTGGHPRRKLCLGKYENSESTPRGTVYNFKDVVTLSEWPFLEQTSKFYRKMSRPIDRTPPMCATPPSTTTGGKTRKRRRNRKVVRRKKKKTRRGA